MISVLRIGSDGLVTIEDVRPGLESMQRLLDCEWLQGIYGCYTTADSVTQWVGYVDHRGRSKSLPLNAVATVFAVKIGWSLSELDSLCGPVVFLGVKPNGADHSCPSVVLRAAHDRLLV